MSTPAGAVPPSDHSPRFYPVNFHPEFGYLAPRPGLRQRFRTASTAAVLGVIAGAIAAFALVRHNHSAEFSSSAMLPSPSAVASGLASDPGFGSPCRTAPWPYAGSGCLANTAAAWQPHRLAERTQADAQPATDQPAAEPAAPPVELRRAAPLRRVQKTVKRDRRKEQEAREPDPRSAYAGRFADRRPPEFAPNNGFGGFGGGFRGSFGW